MASLNFARTRKILARGAVQQVGTDTPVVFRLRKTGLETATSVTVISATSIALVGSSTTDTFAFATYITYGAVVDAINATGRWEAKMLDSLRSGASVSSLLVGSPVTPYYDGYVQVWDILKDTSASTQLATCLTVSRDFDFPSKLTPLHRVHLEEIKYNIVGSSSLYDIGSNSGYAMLADTATTITSAGATVTTGDLGETTFTDSAPGITFGTGSDTGVAAPYATAISEMSALWALLKALPGTNITTPSTLETNNLSSLGAGVFAPGVYTTSLAIDMTASSSITLSGAGDYVFVSTGGAITFGATDSMVLTNGATAERVFWVANNAITTGSTDTLYGNFLTGETGDITIGSTNIIEGRLLSGKAIVVDGTASTFTLPASSAGTVTADGVQVWSRRDTIETKVFGASFVDSTETTINFASGNGKLSGRDGDELVVLVNVDSLVDSADNFLRITGEIE